MRRVFSVPLPSQDSREEVLILSHDPSFLLLIIRIKTIMLYLVPYLNDCVVKGKAIIRIGNVIVGCFLLGLFLAPIKCRVSVNSCRSFCHMRQCKRFYLLQNLQFYIYL